MADGAGRSGLTRLGGARFLLTDGAHLLQMPAMDTARLKEFTDALWNSEIIDRITEYIRIPNQSPLFDPDWQAHGHMDAAVGLAYDWVKKQGIKGAKVEVLRIEDRTPTLLMEVEGTLPGSVLLYGHLDKQPPFEGWRTEEGLGPWTPVIVDGRLYGRGGADDGYAVFASVAAIGALQEQGIPHPRLVVLIECSEESGSPDLPYYIDAYSDRIGTPDLVVCLDSGCGDYDRLWNTTSLRGVVVGTLKVNVLNEGVHSGDASGIVASSFRVIRELLGRIEESATGKTLPDFLDAEIPAARVDQAQVAAEVLGEAVYTKFPFREGMKPMAPLLPELILNRTWRSALSVTGQEGLPPLENAGNVLRPGTSLKLSVRVPPTACSATVAGQLKELLEANPPHDATVEFVPEHPGDGWNAPALAPWLEQLTTEASELYFSNPPCSMGEGGSIPFMGMLGEKFPEAQFLITGVLGPQSNAHGPNEFLHLECARKITASVAYILARFGEVR